MTAVVIIEMGVIFIPCAVGIAGVCRAILAAQGKIDATTLSNLADALSVWSLVAVIGFCAVRLIANVVRADGSATRAKKAPVSAYDQMMTKMLAVLVGFGALVVCEPIGDAAERWTLEFAHTFLLSPTAASVVDYVGFAVQFIVTSGALAIVVKIWDFTGSRFLGLTMFNSPRREQRSFTL